MARLFDDGNNEYLEVTSTPLTTTPFSIVCWFYSDDVTAQQSLISIADKDDTGYHALLLRGDLGGDLLYARTYDGEGEAYGPTTSGYSANTWYHAAGVWAADDDRTAYIDGGNNGEHVGGSRTEANCDRIRISSTADSTPLYYMSGRIAEVAILRLAVTNYQVWLHAQGVPAPVVWPGWAIAAYYPLFETDRDFHNAIYHMTAYNTPSWAPHPPKVLAWYRKYMRGGIA